MSMRDGGAGRQSPAVRRGTCTDESPRVCGARLASVGAVLRRARESFLWRMLCFLQVCSLYFSQTELKSIFIKTNNSPMLSESLVITSIWKWLVKLPRRIFAFNTSKNKLFCIPSALKELLLLPEFLASRTGQRIRGFY